MDRACSIAPARELDPNALEPLSAGRVVVAMSGGVDSSVVAAMLADQGTDVVGISMRLYANPRGDAGKSCCSPDDLLDAREVAATFGFPFYVANYQEEFQKRIVDYFVDEYRRGRTPSPCVLCNDHLKFDTLLERMQALGGEALATGHYARIVEKDGRHALLRGKDRKKDQSYFLFGLRREVLPHIRFPLGELTKPEVRKLAEELGVPTATKPESQDICFVAGGDYADFVEARLSEDELKAGNFVLASSGEVLGQHDGIHRFTVGQRKGLGIAWREPLYVKSIDPQSGDVLVDVASNVGARSFTIERANWQRWAVPPQGFEAAVQVRYRHRPVAARIEVDPNDATRARVEIDADERGITPGQAAVFYESDEVLGGGWVESVL